jgi:flagellin
MNIDTSYNIQGLSQVQAGQLERLSSGQAINKAADDASGLAIADQLGLQKSSLAQSVENFNSGIAMSTIAQSGIASQKELLETMKTETLKAMTGTTSQEGREAIANQLSKYVEQFEQIANTTTYNGQELLKTSGDPAADDISITGEDTMVSLEKADTTSLSDTLKSFLADFSTSSSSRSDFLDAINSGMDQMASYASDFGSASNALESLARNYLTAETNTAAAKSNIMDIDYGKEVSEFSKTNLQSQIGYIMQSQANAVQARSVTLLT